VTSAGAGYTVSFLADIGNLATVTSGLGTAVADGNGQATLTVTVSTGWAPATSVKARDDSAAGTPESDWLVVPVNPAIDPVLTSDKSTVTVGENITFTCSLTSAGAGHTVSFLADVGNTGTVSGLSSAVADSNGQASITVVVGENWAPATSVKVRDDSSVGQPESDWLVIPIISEVDPVLTANKTTITVVESITFTCACHRREQVIQFLSWQILGIWVLFLALEQL